MKIATRRSDKILVVRYYISNRGVTLIEMLIVVMIIGILSVVAYRTIDATTRQSKFDETTKEMAELVKAFVGNPDLLSDGRRISFGYIGDMGRLPDDYGALVTQEAGNWKGPYVPRKFIEDSIGFKTDAWGSPYQYSANELWIRSSGGGQENLTMKIADTVSDLFNNRITGTITDIDGVPPAEFASKISVKLTIPREGNLFDTILNPRTDGYYEFFPVPIGYHLIQLVKNYGTRDSMVRWISVLPRSSVVADFRFATRFRNNLRYVEGTGAAYGVPIKNNIGFSVFNSGDTVTLDSMVVTSLVDSTGNDTVAFYEKVECEGTEIWSFTTNRAGIGQLIAFTTNPMILPNSTARFAIIGFQDVAAGPGNLVDMRGMRIVIRFNDGSIIDFRLQ